MANSGADQAGGRMFGLFGAEGQTRGGERATLSRQPGQPGARVTIDKVQRSGSREAPNNGAMCLDTGAGARRNGETSRDGQLTGRCKAFGSGRWCCVTTLWRRLLELWCFLRLAAGTATELVRLRFFGSVRCQRLPVNQDYRKPSTCPSPCPFTIGALQTLRSSLPCRKSCRLGSERGGAPAAYRPDRLCTVRRVCTLKITPPSSWSLVSNH